jgi:hypothetical protein
MGWSAARRSSYAPPNPSSDQAKTTGLARRRADDRVAGRGAGYLRDLRIGRMGMDTSPAEVLIHPTEPRIVAVLLGSCRRSASHSQIWGETAMTYYIDDGPKSLSGLSRRGPSGRPDFRQPGLRGELLPALRSRDPGCA